MIIARLNDGAAGVQPAYFARFGRKIRTRNIIKAAAMDECFAQIGETQQIDKKQKFDQEKLWILKFIPEN